MSETINEFQTESRAPKSSTFKRKRTVKKIIGVIFSIIIWIIALSLFVICSNNIYQQIFNKEGYTGFFGIGSAVVQSDSMEPNIFVKDIIIYQKADIPLLYASPTDGDIVIYKRGVENGEELIVHRLHSIADGYAITKGDNNSVEDDPFEVNKIVGKYMFRIPKAGVVVQFLTTIWASVALVCSVILFIVLRVTFYIVHRKKRLRSISPDKETQKAIASFFDI